MNEVQLAEIEATATQDGCKDCLRLLTAYRDLREKARAVLNCLTVSGRHRCTDCRKVLASALGEQTTTKR